MAKKAKTKVAKKPAAKASRKPAAKAGSLAALAYEQIKEKILTLHFLPGQYLNEGALCAMLGAGRTPVHQALQRLELEGLVEIMPRKGVIVQPDSISEILKILDSRATVEAELARNAAERATPEDSEELKALAREGYGNGKPTDIDTFTTGDRSFHEKFAEMAGNPVLSDFARTLHERSIRYWYLHLWQTMDTKATIRQHATIAEMIAKRDGDGAAKAVRDHIESLRERLMKAQNATQRRIPPRR
jgi:GntR family transcriptional regulator, rspAB operon transcriptional repressor